MKTTDFNSNLSSSKLRENMNKMFGMNVNLAKYSREQLEDMRNKLRTRVFQQEGQAGINDLLTNETYQKDKAMLALLNTRIKEMLGEDIAKLRDKLAQLDEAKKGVRAPKHKIHAQGTAAKDYDGDGKKESPKDEVWGSRAKAAAKAGKPFEEGAKPDFLDMDKDGNKKEPMKKAVKDKNVKEETGKFDKTDTTWTDKSGKKHPAQRVTRKTDQLAGASDDAAEKKAKKTKESVVAEKDEGKPGKGFEKIVKKATPKYGKKTAMKIAGAQREKMKKAGKLEEANSQFSLNVRKVNESLIHLLRENEEEKAKAITAAGDMVNDFTSWMQRVGQYQTKSMIELADAIRSDFGTAEAEQFKQSVGPALQATLEVLMQQREAISNAVAALAGEAAPMEPMGAEPGADAALPPEPGVDASTPDAMNPDMGGDEFGAADAAAGGAEASGREMRESKFARKLAESHSIISKLAR